MKNERRIGYIENGTVIDHIPSREVWRIIEILRIKQKNAKISIGVNYDSKKIGKKDFLKIEDYCPSSEDLDLIALIGERVTVSIIKEGQVVNKRIVEIPSRLENIIICPNPNCISRDYSEGIDSLIYYNGEKFKCGYCDYVFGKDKIIFKFEDGTRRLKY